MKNQKLSNTALLGFFLIFAGCDQARYNDPDIQFENGFPKLANKIVTLRLSYKVNEVQSADFRESHFSRHGYTGREVITENHHKYYMEVYEDNTMAYAIERFSGKWKNSEGLVRFIDDRVEYYDENRTLLNSKPYALAAETAEMSKLLDLKQSVLLQNTKPSAFYSLIKPILTKEAASVQHEGGTIYYKILTNNALDRAELRAETQIESVDVAYNELIYS